MSLQSRIKCCGVRSTRQVSALRATGTRDRYQGLGIALEVVKLPEAKRGFVLLPQRWVVERSFAWTTRCRRLVKDDERYAATLAGLHVVASVCFMVKQADLLMAGAYTL